MIDQPHVQVGDIVLDIGCTLTQEQRLRGIVGPPSPCRVKKVFPWGLRVSDVDDPTDEWDCEHWEILGGSMERTNELEIDMDRIMNRFDRIRRLAAMVDNVLRSMDPTTHGIKLAIDTIDELAIQIESVVGDVLDLGQMTKELDSLLTEAKRPDPIAEALNSGDGTYRP